MKKLHTSLVVLLAGVLTTGSAQAAIVASLHVDNNITDAVNMDVAGPLAARDTSGNANTIGTLSGSVNFLAATPGQAISDIYGYSGNSQFRDLNRFGDNANGGSVVTWDFDFTGQSSPAWNFHFDFTAEGNSPDRAGQLLGFYISYTDGGSLSLDTTDIKTATPGASALVTSNSAEYVSLLALDPNATSGVSDVDITSIINTAIANGGGIRIALVDNTFQNTINIFNDSGVQAIPEPATFAFLGGLVALGLVLYRRRMQHSA